MKRWLKSGAVQAAIAAAAALYIRLFYATTRWQVVGEDHVAALVAARRSFVGCFWHGRMLAMGRFWNARAPMAMLVSAHTDGQIIARVIARLRCSTIVGSSTRGGASAMRAIVRALREGTSVCFTPDGPRGPRMRAAAGPAVAAKLAGAPIIIAAYSTSRARILGSWDRFLLPMPFGRGAIVVAEPIIVAGDADDAAIEAARALVEARLNEATATADRLCGREPIAPALAVSRAEA